MSAEITPAQRAAHAAMAVDGAGPRSMREGYLELRARDVALLEAAGDLLERVYAEVRDYPAERPHSSDSYLPPEMVDEIATVLGLPDANRAPR